MLLATPSFSTSLFSRTGSAARPYEFVTEMSTLDCGGRRAAFGRVWDDACDVGFTLVSARTGDSIRLVEHACHRDADGDVTHWVLKPVAEDVRKNPALRGVVVTVYND